MQYITKLSFYSPFLPRKCLSVGPTVDSQIIIRSFSDLYIPGLPVGFIFVLPLGYVTLGDQINCLSAFAISSQLFAWTLLKLCIFTSHVLLTHTHHGDVV